MIIALSNDKVLVWGMPPLSPHPLDFLNDNPTRIPPLLKTSLPDDITRKSECILWETILDWYAGSSQSIHLGVLDEDLDSDIHNVEIVIKPDLSDIFLYVINTCQFARGLHSICSPQYHILEDHTHVSEVDVTNDDSRIYIRSTPENPIFLGLSLPGLGALHMSTSCPASGRVVYFRRRNYREMVVVDFLKYV